MARRRGNKSARHRNWASARSAQAAGPGSEGWEKIDASMTSPGLRPMRFDGPRVQPRGRPYDIARPRRSLASDSGSASCFGDTMGHVAAGIDEHHVERHVGVLHPHGDMAGGVCRSRTACPDGPLPAGAGTSGRAPGRPASHDFDSEMMRPCRRRDREVVDGGIGAARLTHAAQKQVRKKTSQDHRRPIEADAAPGRLGGRGPPAPQCDEVSRIQAVGPRPPSSPWAHRRNAPENCRPA